jgi:predicted aspartyl protease
MKFDYPEYLVDPTSAAPERASLFRPVIRVRMTGSKASRTIWALLDTGADESYITESLAVKLGVTPLSAETSTINSASGEMLAWYGQMAVEVSEGHERNRFAMIVGVVQQDWTEMILGHVGFFEHFDANFSDNDRIVTLTARIA